MVKASNLLWSSENFISISCSRFLASNSPALGVESVVLVAEGITAVAFVASVTGADVARLAVFLAEVAVAAIVAVLLFRLVVTTSEIQS